MHNYMINFIFRTIFVALIALNPILVFADYTIVGDIIINGSPANINNFNNGNGTSGGTGDTEGGRVDGFIIGDTATGGLLADGAAPFLGTLEALVSDNAIIGNQQGSIGAANIEDFISGGNWIIDEDLVVGHAGIGYLDLLNAAGIGDSPTSAVTDTIFVGGGTGSTAPIVGSGQFGQGIIRVNGLGSRLQAQGTVSGISLIVGHEGVGVVEASGRSSINTIQDTFIGSSPSATFAGAAVDLADGTVRITDLGTSWTAAGDVTIGGLAGLSHGKIEILNEAVFQFGDPNAPTAPVLTNNPRGTITLSNGTLRMLPQAANLITNDGVITGDGFIDGGITNGATGQIRNAAGIANQREYLRIAEAVTNNGLIESIGGEMEFENLVTSNGDIVARDAIMRFRATELGDTGLTYDLILQDGDTYFLEESTIYGDINWDLSSGTPTLTTDPEALLVGSITVTVLAAASTSGPQAATSTEADFNVTVTQTDHFNMTGALDLGVGVIDLGVTYDDDDPTQVGDMLTVITAAGGLSGTFSNDFVFADEKYWQIGYTANEVTITAVSPIFDPADLNMDGFVDGLDLGALLGSWGTTTTPDMGELNGIPPVDGLDLGILLSAWNPPPAAATAAVPEPSSALLMIFGIACVGIRKTR